ncbi:FG-GAP repeat-containing protein [Striga asiatica]|uniref:FG-GAP repeat-containing protein n=1 Tax=Striga asiatica TaxID=4170 RepID=A0A5A7Q8L4_STRAF|nr:FG-GAP repeat-containing protein [Striga asiatica]
MATTKSPATVHTPSISKPSPWSPVYMGDAPHQLDAKERQENVVGQRRDGATLPLEESRVRTEDVRMRKRDLAILSLSAFAIFFSLQHEGDFSFKEAWFHLSDDYPIKYEADRLPPPVVADLNGDGKKEVLVATHDAKIQLLALRGNMIELAIATAVLHVLEPHARRVDEGFSEARVLAEVSLLPDKLRIATGRRAVAMATGVIERNYNKREPRKQVLVVVTSGWSVMCFDHNLKKLWDVNLQKDFPHNAHHREIAISISNYTLRHGDSGLIIIGGRMEMQPHMHLDPFEEIEMADKNAEEHRRSATEKDASDNAGTVDLRHFAFYAFAGRSGELRWSRKNENIEAQSSDASQLIPQHNYKLDAHALNTRRPGEFECRDFRESILGVMPHRWDRREDTVLELAHFKRHKRKTLKKVPGKTTNYQLHKPEEKQSPGKDVTKKVSNVIDKAVNIAKSAKKKQLWWVPNVVVAHEKEGIEAIHLATGRTLCQLHLQEGGLHADINGDGVLDHVQVVGANGAEQTVVSGSMEVLRPCWAVATSGVPVREQLFNASICHHSPFNLFQHGDFSRSYGRHVDTSSLEVATPILIPRKDGHRHRKGSRGDVVFLTNRGEVTSYSPGLHGHDAIWNWQISTGATWSNLPSLSGLVESPAVVPTLKPFPLRTHDTVAEPLILAAGDQEAVVLSPGGSTLAAFDLPAPPTHALVCQDFSGDGLTDIVLVTSSGIYGFVQTRQPGALFFSTLVGCLLVVMGVLFVSQYLNASASGKGKPRALSTAQL